MKILGVIFAMLFAFFLADFLWSQHASEERSGVTQFENAPAGKIPFDHALHGQALGLECSACHTGAISLAAAKMPSKKDCLDCHRLPVTENPGIEKLDSALADAPEEPWSKIKRLPEHVVFHHGVHAAANVKCADCHGEGFKKNRYGGELFSMQSCLQCHKGETFKDRKFKPAATDCAACHR